MKIGPYRIRKEAEPGWSPVAGEEKEDTPRQESRDTGDGKSALKTAKSKIVAFKFRAGSRNAAVVLAISLWSTRSSAASKPA